MTDLNKLAAEMRAAAEAATPGPWRTNGRHIQAPPFGDVASARVFSDFGNGCERNAVHIAAANPKNVLALLDERERLLAALDNLVRRLDEVHSDDRYTAVWTSYKLHGNEYIGPFYDIELKAARAALAGAAPEDGQT